MKTIITLITLSFILQGCTWDHHGEIVKDAKGNLYRLESSEYRNESYDLIPIKDTTSVK
jgi:hypothetical protein